MNRIAWICLFFPALVGCDRLAERAGMPDPAKIEAEGKALGAGCRDAGRGLENCFELHDRASKSAIYAGWKEMNEYMLKNNMQPMGAGADGKEGHAGKAGEDKPAGSGDAH